MTAAPIMEFSGYPLAVGELYGVRVWLVDSYGRLRARRVDAVPPWRPGVNVAACHAVEAGAGSMWSVFARGGYAGVAATNRSEEAPPPPQNPTHPAPDEDCKCGFYAYTTPGTETAQDVEGAVLGIVRATGRTLVGAKGFRCEKAEIAALLDPTRAKEPGDWARWRRDRLRLVYPDVPLLDSREELLEFAPIESTAPAPDSDEFWSLP